MPTSVEKLFKDSGLTPHGQTGWGQRIDFNKCGFYVVSLSDKYDKLVCYKRPDLCDKEIIKWMEVVRSGNRSILVDSEVANLNSIKTRLEKLWLPDETILYIGKAGPSRSRTVETRLHEYYDTKFGSKKWHAGGHWINSLGNLFSLTVFYTEYAGADIDIKEEQMISYFMKNVSPNTKMNLHDKINCYPFANKEIHFVSQNRKIRKKHGFKNQTVDCGKDWRKES